jgi:hypothetical protein
MMINKMYRMMFIIAMMAFAESVFLVLAADAESATALLLIGNVRREEMMEISKDIPSDNNG